MYYRHCGRRGTPAAPAYAAKRELHMEQMYEVLRFIEHGAHCRQSMDCVRGTVMAEFLKKNPQIEKATLFRWFRELCVCLEQYHRSRKGRKEYRYLNPYSIIVTEELELRLLDLEAPENGFVMKQMQRRAVREHFVKPVCEMERDREYRVDLFAYGRMAQFLLAYVEMEPDLTRMEEFRLSRIIGRCTGERRGTYESMTHVIRDLPPVPKDAGAAVKQRKNLRKSILAGACICVVLCLVAVLIRGGI